MERGATMPFIIGFILGVFAAFMITCIIASKKIDEAYMEGYHKGLGETYEEDFWGSEE
jgi:hypothetical protein